MKHLIHISLFLVLCLPFLLSPVAVSALGLGDAQEQLEAAGGAAYGEGAETSLEVVIGNIINTLLSISGVIFLVLMVYGGYLWMTARGEEKTVEKAKNVIWSGIIGIIIVALSYGITYFVINALLNSGSGTPEGFKPSPF